MVEDTCLLQQFQGLRSIRPPLCILSLWFKGLILAAWFFSDGLHADSAGSPQSEKSGHVPRPLLNMAETGSPAIL